MYHPSLSFSASSHRLGDELGMSGRLAHKQVFHYLSIIPSQCVSEDTLLHLVTSISVRHLLVYALSRLSMEICLLRTFSRSL